MGCVLAPIGERCKASAPIPTNPRGLSLPPTPTSARWPAVWVAVPEVIKPYPGGIILGHSD